MESKSKKTDDSNYKWLLLIFFPIFWGLFGLAEGKGFFEYILENIFALFILLFIGIILIVIILVTTKEK